MSQSSLLSLQHTSLCMACCAALFLSGCSDDDDDAAPAALSTLPITAVSAGLTTLGAALNAADLTMALEEDGPYTVFAPTNSAFADLGPTLDTWLMPENKTTLAGVLTYHVLDGSVKAADVMANTRVPTLQGNHILLDIVGDDVYANEFKVQQPDVLASNGVAHVIDGVLRPTKNIYDTLVDRDGFDTLTAKLAETDLDSVLMSSNNYTLFAPTDAAFAMLDLSESDGDTLKQTLLYHVLADEVVASEALSAAEAGASVATANSMADEISLSMKNDALTINDTATVTVINIAATNGVIHVIDMVLTPMATDS